MRRAAAALAALGIGLAGCGSGGGPLEPVSARPPGGAEPAGKVAERQGSNNPDAGQAIYRLRPREGERLSYAVTVRNPTDKAVSVTGVVADADRDGAFVPERVEHAPVQIPPGGTVPVTVSGRVRGCRFGGQRVPLAGPELRLGDGSSQQLKLGIRVELVVQGCP